MPTLKAVVQNYVGHLRLKSIHNEISPVSLAVVLLAHSKAGGHCYEVVRLWVSVDRKSYLLSSPSVKS